jgi:hypothetical protein
MLPASSAFQILHTSGLGLSDAQADPPPARSDELVAESGLARFCQQHGRPMKLCLVERAVEWAHTRFQRECDIERLAGGRVAGGRPFLPRSVCARGGDFDWDCTS